MFNLIIVIQNAFCSTCEVPVFLQKKGLRRRHSADNAQKDIIEETYPVNKRYRRMLNPLKNGKYEEQKAKAFIENNYFNSSSNISNDLSKGGLITNVSQLRLSSEDNDSSNLLPTNLDMEESDKKSAIEQVPNENFSKFKKVSHFNDNLKEKKILNIKDFRESLPDDDDNDKPKADFYISSSKEDDDDKPKVDFYISSSEEDDLNINDSRESLPDDDDNDKPKADFYISSSEEDDDDKPKVDFYISSSEEDDLNINDSRESLPDDDDLSEMKILNIND